MTLPFEYPVFLALIPFGILVVWRLIRQKDGVGISTLKLLKGMPAGLSIILVERLFISAFLIASFLILARPIQVIKSSTPIYQEARDISIVLDMSGSMNDTSSGASQSKKIAAKEVIIQFVTGRPQDRIALIGFENKAYLEWPLSLDHEALIFRLNDLEGGGGTTISSGIIAALKHHRVYGKNPGAIIVISDGVSEIFPEEKSDIEENLGDMMIYFIRIGNDNSELIDSFESYLKKLGGKVYHGESDDLPDIFDEISRLESSPVVWEQRVTTVYRFGILPYLAFLCLMLAGIVETFREVSE